MGQSLLDEQECYLHYGERHLSPSNCCLLSTIPWTLYETNRSWDKLLTNQWLGLCSNSKKKFTGRKLHVGEKKGRAAFFRAIVLNTNSTNQIYDVTCTKNSSDEWPMWRCGYLNNTSSDISCQLWTQIRSQKDQSPTRGTNLNNKELKEVCSVSTKDFSPSNYVKLLFARIPYLRLPLISISRQKQTRVS